MQIAPGSACWAPGSAGEYGRCRRGMAAHGGAGGGEEGGGREEACAGCVRENAPLRADGYIGLAVCVHVAMSVIVVASMDEYGQVWSASDGWLWACVHSGHLGGEYGAAWLCKVTALRVHAGKDTELK